MKGDPILGGGSSVFNILPRDAVTEDRLHLLRVQVSIYFHVLITDVFHNNTM